MEEQKEKMEEKMEEHKEKYKHKPNTVEQMRDKRRHHEVDIRKEKRDKVLTSKRIRTSLSEPDFEYEEEQNHDKVREAAQLLVKKEGDCHEVLVTTRRGFAQGSALIDTFLSIENSMASLVGLLTGSDPDLQLEAAWCLTNMSASIHEHAALVTKQAGPYLVTYLSSGNKPLQDQCAWAIGNLAGDSDECRESLHAQGVMQPLVDLLSCDMANVVQSAAFALSNLARGGPKYTSDMLERGCLAHILPQLTAENATNEEGLVSELCWILTYLATRPEHHEALVKEETTQRLSALIVHLAAEQAESFALLTPALRALGNLSSTGGAVADIMSNDAHILPALEHLLDSQHRHIKKETLWVLSNITGNEIICKAILQKHEEKQLMSKITEQLAGAYDIKKEALFCVCNLCGQGHGFCEAFLEMGCLDKIVPMLQSNDIESSHLALAFTDILFKDCGAKAVQMFEEAQGLTGLEYLEYHNNDTLRTEANQLLDTYFYKVRRNTEKEKAQDAQKNDASANK